MDNQLAQLIEQRANEWKTKLQCLSIGGESLLKQAEELQKNEDKNNSLKINDIPDTIKKASHFNQNFKFNHFLAEPLLREGSLLLDRCLLQRREYEELKTKFFEACVQVQELVELNRITKKEEETYKTSVEIAQSELNALQKEQKSIEEVIKILSDDLMKNDARTKRLAEDAYNSARAIAYANNWSKTIKLDKNGQTLPRAIEDWTREYAENSELLRGEKEKMALEVQLTQQKGTLESLTEKINATTKQIELKRKQLEFQVKRNDVARFVALRRAEQLALPDGALNYQKQMLSVKERLQNDLWAAWLRLSESAKGFEMLYEYVAFNNKPNDIFSKENIQKDKNSREFDFDSLVTWTQLTNTWLASFSDTQQQVTRSFSLRQLLQEQGKNLDDNSNSTNERSWTFKLNEQHFFNRQFVRLRSFSMQIESGHFSGSWNVAIKPPSEAIIRLNDSKVKPLKQDVGTLFLGRVNETTYAVIPESSAPPKLFNASPIGKNDLSGEWSIQILANSTAAIPMSAINDIDIHLTVALV